MAIFSGLFLFFTYWQSRGLEATVSNLAAPSQNFCQNLLNIPAEHINFYKAIGCGVSLNEPRYQILKTVALWHLVVVSAGHFSVLIWLLNKALPSSTVLKHSVLVLFCLATGAQPPIIRSYLQMLLQNTSGALKLSIPSPYLVCFSGGLTILLFPTWSNSWSFLLSWTCGILVGLFEKQSPLLQSIGIAIGLFPVVSVFSVPHPLGFFFNFVFTAPLSMILFPLALLLMLIPQLHIVADYFLNGILFLLTFIAGNAPLSQQILKPNEFQLKLSWIYLIALQILYLIIFHRRRHNHEF